MSSPSEILSRAADLIRDTAAKATRGPWESEREFAHRNVVYAKHEVLDSVGVAGRRLDLPRVFTGQIASRERSQFEADARWIALMSPVVAPSMADLLQQMTGMWRLYEDRPLPRREIEQRVGSAAVAALTLAEQITGKRAVLGVEEDSSDG